MKKEAKKEDFSAGKFFSAIFFILNIILGAISLLVGIIGLTRGFILISLLYLLLSIFIFLPKKLIKIPNYAKFLIATAFFIIFLIINISTNWNTGSAIVSHNMQETFILNGGASNISMLIYNTSKTETILVDGQEKTTAGYFLAINCELTNLGDSAVTLNPVFDIIDNKNQTYAGLGFSGSQEYFQPNLKKQSYFVFELPDEASDINFRIKDETSLHVINLGI